MPAAVDPGRPASPASTMPQAAAPPTASHARVIVAIVVVVLVVAASAGYYFFVLRKPAAAAPLDEAGFTQGQLVTFTYNGTNTFLCTPGLSVMFPGNSTAAAASSTTSCEVGNASQTAVPQVPEWVLVPAFAGLSIFGVASLGATARGFPAQNGTAVLTDCGAGGSPTACLDHPTYIFSPVFTIVENYVGVSSVAGLPLGVLPTPSHDHVIDTSATYPNVEWGTIAVLVFDPNIFPNRTTGVCTVSVPSNLSSPTGNCLTSLTNLNRAFSTCSKSVVNFNTAVSNPIWKALGSPCEQVLVAGALTISQVDTQLNSNLYIPFSVSPGLPATLPT
jgi:flagellar basal body-associated protein FliL